MTGESLVHKSVIGTSLGRFTNGSVHEGRSVIETYLVGSSTCLMSLA